MAVAIVLLIWLSSILCVVSPSTVSVQVVSAFAGCVLVLGMCFFISVWNMSLAFAVRCCVSPLPSFSRSWLTRACLVTVVVLAVFVFRLVLIVNLFNQTTVTAPSMSMERVSFPHGERLVFNNTDLGAPGRECDVHRAASF